MAVEQRLRRAYKEHLLRRRLSTHQAEEQQELIAHQPAVVSLQRQIGNRAVQRLIAQGSLNSHGIVQTKPNIQRCAACKGQEEELSVSVGMGNQVQRFWGDEEEEEGGGSWLDTATDWVSDTASDATDWVSDTAGDAYDTATDTASDVWDTASDTAGDAVDWASGIAGDAYDWATDTAGDAVDWVSDTATEAYDWASDTAGNAVDWASDTWDDLWGDEEEGESSDTEDSDWTDWLPDWWSDEDSEGEEDSEEGEDLVDITAECETEDGIGFGGSKQMKLHGLTVANYNHGKPIPEPFPSSVTVTTGKKGNDDVFTASGTYEAEFLASPSITLPTVPSGLTPCQEKAVQAFIDGPLTAHENDHKTAFKDNYDGKFTATVNVKDIKDTDANRKIAMTNPVNAEDQVRTAKANKESKKLDPWKQTVTGLDCKD